MATRYYLTTRAPGVDYRVRVQGPWEDSFSGPRIHSTREWIWMLSTSKTEGGTGTSRIIGETNDTPNYDMLVSRWMTPALDAQTISGTLDLIVPSLRSDFASTVVWKLYVYISNGDGAGTRTVLLDYTDPTDWNTVGQGRALAAAQTLATAACLAGDHVVVELGVRFVTNPFPVDDVTIFDTIAQVWFGTLTGGGAALADATVGGATTRAPFLDFSHTFVEQALPAAPANDTCATATVIAAMPYHSPAINTSQSTSPDRAVWFSWTASGTTRVFFTVLGSNFPIAVRVFTDGCGVLTGVTATQEGGQWLQQDQTVATWVPVAGVTYLIRVQGSFTNHPSGALRVHLTEYSAPAFGDVYVNCQSITAWRDSTLINWTDSFVGLTPTGSAVDYTLRSLADLNGGFHTSPRLVVALFDSPLLEYLDLATLSHLQSEIAYIDLQVNPPAFALPGDAHLSSLIFDRPGDLYTGQFGDEYDVIGALGSANSINPRRVSPLVVSGFATILASYGIAPEVQGSDYIELSSDQQTLFYTSAGQLVKRFNLATGLQLANFATVPGTGGSRPGLRGLRLLPPGDGTGGLLVTDGTTVKRLNAAGAVIQTYTPSEPQYAQDLDKVEMTVDATEFWVTDQLSCRLYKFNLATGAEVLVVETWLPPGQLSGFSIYNGYRAGLESPPGFPAIPGPPGYTGIPSPTTPAPGPGPGVPPGVGCPTDFPIDIGGSGHGCSVPFFP